MKKHNTMLVILLCILSITVSAVSAHSADWTAWTFQVPVELSNVPPAISKGTVTCYVCSNAPDAYTNCNLVSHIHSTDFAIANRSFNSTVTVPVNTINGIDPYSGKNWLCKVLLYFNNQSAYVSQVMTLDPSKPKKDIISGVFR